MPLLTLQGLFQANSVQLQSPLECSVAHYPVIHSHFPIRVILIFNFVKLHILVTLSMKPVIYNAL